MRTSDLTGPALDWAVAKCEGFNPGVLTIEEQMAAHESIMRPHYNDEEWEEHLRVWNKHVLPTLRPVLVNVQHGGFKDSKPMLIGCKGHPFAFSSDWAQGGPIIEREGISIGKADDPDWWAFKGWKAEDGMPGPTPLIAAMRCFVASRLGDTIDIPEELQ